MRNLHVLRLGALGGLVALAACQIGEAPAPARPVYYPQPPPPPQAFQHPGYVYYANGAPPPAPPPMPPALSVRDFMNMAHLQQAAASPARCNIPRQVAPGVFAHFDCFPYKRIAIAVTHATPLKLGMMRAGKLKWNRLARLSPIPLAPRSNLVGGAPAAVSAPAQPLPDLVDHRLNGLEGPIKDQGDVGACTSFGLSSTMDNALRRAGLNITTSPEHLWSHYGVPTMEDAASSNLNKGITTYDAMPYSGKEACELSRDGTDDCGQTYNVRPNTAQGDAPLETRIAAADAANGHRVTGFEELQGSPPNIDEIVATLASGADLWAAFNVDGSAWANSRMQNYVIPDWVVPDGGHSVSIAGYRKVNGGYQFLIHNSWGVSWGDQGYAWVSQAMVQRWLHLAYKIKTDADPTPVAPKTDEDCPGDQVMDSVTNTCVGICPDQSRPANGQCPNGPAPGPQPLPLPGIPGLPGLQIPGIPPIPGWGPPPAPSAPPAPGPAPAPTTAPTQAPVWPWPVPTNWPQFLPPPPK